MNNHLNKIKSQMWFYEFELPDGTKTESYLPEVARQIHATREKALRKYLSKSAGEYSDALDISCHEGYFSLILSEFFDNVTGLDKNHESLEKAKLISSVLGRERIRYENLSIEMWNDKKNVDFVLCYGLLYHVENPVQILRKLATLANKTVCIETQVLPFETNCSIEDGSYLWQREMTGMFGLCVDYSSSPEGGLTDLALVPSRQTLIFLLKQFGFKTVSFYTPEINDYEQFVRNHRVIIFAEK